MSNIKEKAERLMDVVVRKSDKEGRKPNEIETAIYEVAQAYLKLLEGK